MLQARIIPCLLLNKKNWSGSYQIYTNSGTKKTGLDPINIAIKMEKYGAGEIFLNSIDRDGTMKGFDINFIKKITDSVNIPVIVCGGAGSLNDIVDAIKVGNVPAVAAGSLFIYHGRRRAVLINYPSQDELDKAFNLKK